MAETYLWQSPLADLARATGNTVAGTETQVVSIRQRPRQIHVGLRGRSDDKDFVRGVEAALALPLPVQAMTSATSDDGRHSVLWLGPDEWIFCHDDPTFEAVPVLEAALAGTFHAVVVLSDSRAVLRIGGPQATDLLAKAVTLDLHKSHFPVGACAQSTFAGSQGLLHCTGLDTGGHRLFDVHVPRSFAAYVWTWLQDGAAEFLQLRQDDIDLFSFAE